MTDKVTVMPAGERHTALREAESEHEGKNEALERELELQCKSF